MKFKPRWQKLLLLLVAVVAGYVPYELRMLTNQIQIQPERERWQGLEKNGADTTLRSPMTLNEIVEGAFDTDNDSVIDFRTVSIFKGLYYESIYEASAIDESGWPSIVDMSLGNPPSTLRLEYANQDRSIERISVILTNHYDDRETHTYTDFNLDGLFDEMQIVSSGKASKTYILFERRWKLTEHRDESSGLTLWIREDGGPLRRVEFNGSEWNWANRSGNVDSQNPNF